MDNTKIASRTAWKQFASMLGIYGIGLGAAGFCGALLGLGNAGEQALTPFIFVVSRATSVWLGVSLARWKDNGAELAMGICGFLFGLFAIGGYALFSDKREIVTDVEVEVIEETLELQPEWEEAI